VGKDKAGETYSRAPKLFNASGDIITDNIGGGSKIQVAVVPYCWYTGTLGAGITLQPKAVMVHDLVTWGDGGSAVAYGFDVSEAKDQHVERELRMAKTGTDDEEITW
jgi:hypothetical protein